MILRAVSPSSAALLLRPATLVALLLCAACGSPDAPPESRPAGEAAEGRAPTGSEAASKTADSGAGTRSPMTFPEETRLGNLRMLTDGGENAEAYWSWDGRRLVFQARRGDEGCDSIRVMNADGTGDRVLASDGAHTCAFFLPGDDRIVYSSTRTGGPQCPPKPDMSQGYVWPLHPEHDVYVANADGSNPRRITTTPGYDAEATVASDGTIVFTSVRDGDLDIYTMDADGENVKRLTDTPGYDGGPFFSPDGSMIAWRAWHPETEEELAAHRRLLAQNLIRPGRLDIWVMNADGSNKRKVTDLPGASFAPSFLPGNAGLIFSSNLENPRGRNFDLYTIDLDGENLRRVTWNPSFDGFPMFAPDGHRLAFCSNRANAKRGDTNVFVADWLPDAS